MYNACSNSLWHSDIKDGVVRIWNTEAGNQSYRFSKPNGVGHEIAKVAMHTCDVFCSVSRSDPSLVQASPDMNHSFGFG